MIFYFRPSIKQTSYRRRNACLCLLAILLIFGPNRSQAELTTSTQFRDALQSLSDGLPSLAVQKLELLLNDNQQSYSEQEKNKISKILLEALLRAEKYPQTLSLFSSHPELQKNSLSQFWNALALTKSGHPAAAEKNLRQLLADPTFPYHDWATLALAQNQASQNYLQQAHQLLQPLLDSPQAEIAARARITGAEFYLQHQQTEHALTLLGPHSNDTKSQASQNAFLYLRARIAMQMKDFPKAIAYLESLRENENPAFQSSHQKAVLLLADACLAANRKEDAIRHYWHLIKAHPDSILLPLAFDQLAQTGALAQAEINQNLEQWANDDAIHPERQSYSQFHHAQNSSNGLALFIAKHPSHSLTYAAKIRLAELLIKQNQYQPAQTLLSELLTGNISSKQSSQVIFLQALTAFTQGDFVKAESKFLEAANDKSPSASSDLASFNVALTALHADDRKTFTQYQDRLKQSKNFALPAELLLEQGLFLATQSITKAFATLSLFLEKYPDNTRTADAHLALAELYLNEVPPKPVSARAHLQAAADAKLSQQQQESLDYIAVWIEESDGNHSAIIEQALLYLDHWQDSRRAPEIRLKLGEAYYREKDFFQAVAALELLAENHPESPLAGPALFSAGKAASLSKQPAEQARAIELWARLAENESDPLALYARHEQGLFKLKLDEFDDAITAFDSILEHQPPAPLELKLAVLADRGQAMFNIATARNNKPELLLNAIHSFDRILSESKSSHSWRNQAAVRKAKCLERLGRLGDALDTYNDVLQSDRLREGSDFDAPVAQVEWFFRAGLGAIRLLREKEQWQRAIRIADNLANSGSPRAIEAAKLANHIRLKHFIWDQPER